MIAYFDMFSGVSGDMIVGSLVDAGLDPEALRASLSGLDVPGFGLEVTRVRRGALSASLAVWRFEDASEHRHLPEIERIIRAARFPAAVEERSLAVFRRLAEAESRVHGIPAEAVHFHEVGALDALLDVCGAVSGLNLLGVERVEASAFRVGGGYVAAAHGRLPVPAPAVGFLLEGWRVDPVDVTAELTTPTGAAIVTALAQPPGGPPALLVRRVGYGAGSRDAADPPNCLRLFLGEPRSAARKRTRPGLARGLRRTARGAAHRARAEGLQPSLERLTLLETAIDDMNPQLYGWLEERLFAAGAREVSFSPLSMKRGRPGTLVRCLADPERVDGLAEVLFRETTTLGVRWWPVRRRALARSEEIAETSLGPVRVKRVAGVAGGEELRPEYEDCRRIARASGLPLRAVAARVAQELTVSAVRVAPPAGTLRVQAGADRASDSVPAPEPGPDAGERPGGEGPPKPVT